MRPFEEILDDWEKLSEQEQKLRRKLSIALEIQKFLPDAFENGQASTAIIARPGYNESRAKYKVRINDDTFEATELPDSLWHQLYTQHLERNQ